MTNRQNPADEHRRAQKQSKVFADQARGRAREIQKRQGDRAAEFAKTALTFLEVEADTGLTLAQLAAKSDDAKARTRNRLHARQAYDKLVKYRGTAAAAAGEELDALDTKIAKLRAQLQSLGETL